MSVDSVIRDITSKSDLALGSAPYVEIASGLTELGLNLAFFVFNTREHSSCARTLNGTTATQPTLAAYVKYNVDLLATGVDPTDGNWSDKWLHTNAARNAANAILRRGGFGADYVSDHTFIFLNSREDVAFQEIGRECKRAVEAFICEEVPGVIVSRLFWNGRQYFAVMKDRDDYKRAKRAIEGKASRALRAILSAADVGSYCQSYEVELAFGVSGMDLFHLMRENI